MLPWGTPTSIIFIIEIFPFRCTWSCLFPRWSTRVVGFVWFYIVNRDARPYQIYIILYILLLHYLYYIVRYKIMQQYNTSCLPMPLLLFLWCDRLVQLLNAYNGNQIYGQALSLFNREWVAIFLMMPFRSLGYDWKQTDWSVWIRFVRRFTLFRHKLRHLPLHWIVS